MKFLPYNPEQAYMLPPRVADVLGEGHLLYFLCRVVERLDRSPFEQDYEDEGRRAYAPATKVLSLDRGGCVHSRKPGDRTRTELDGGRCGAGAAEDPEGSWGTEEAVL